MSPVRTPRPRLHATLSRALTTAAMLGAGAATLCAGASEAAAQDDIDLPIPGLGPPPVNGGIEQVGKRGFWRAGRPRQFISAAVELGNLYVRSTVAVGYGRPHWSWVGAEGSSSVSPAGVGAYAGLRLSTIGIDLRAGARYAASTNHHFLTPRETYIRDDIERATGPRLRYVTLEAEVASSFPILRGNLFGVAGVYHVLDTPVGFTYFDQSLQVVTTPPWLWRGRLGYLVRVDRWDMFRLGAAVEVLGSPERGSVVVRTGPALTAVITHHFEAYGAALLVVSSPDKLGLAGGQMGELGFRYRWATGDRWPELP